MGADINRRDLATFLRSRRARRRPHEVGLPEGPRRRTPGLRRQEVAELAAISVDYYSRLEQARGPRPSKQVLAALARALMLTADERTYLFDLVGEACPVEAGPSSEVPAPILALLESMTEIPAYVMDARYELLAANRLLRLLVDLDSRADGDRNMIRWMFASPAAPHWDLADHVAFARSSVADLRAAAARYPGDPGIQGLVAELQAISPRFAAMWADHDVEVRRTVTKKVVHPLLGAIEIDCQVLHIPDTDQRLVVYVAAPGTSLRAALETLTATDA